MLNRIERMLRRKRAAFIPIAVLALTAYCNSFNAPFELDDFGSISNNYSIRDLFDIPAMWKFYSNRIVVYLTFAINYRLHGDDVVGYHIANIAIHIFNGFLLFQIARHILSLRYFDGSMPGRYKNVVSLCIALVFICSPLQVNAVTYVVQRTASLATMFYFLAILFFIRFRKYGLWRYFACTLLFTVLAMFTKENSITIPFMLAVIELLFFLNDGKTSWRKRLAFILILASAIPLVPATELLFKGYSQSDPNVHFKASTSMDRMQYFYTELNVVVHYIKLLFIPVGQNFDYSNDYPFSRTLLENRSWLSLAILAVIGISGFICIKRNRLISLGIFWFFIGLSVESSFISIKDVYFEHRLYFPAAGFFIAVSGLLFYRRKVKKADSVGFAVHMHLLRKPMVFFIIAISFMLVYYTGLTIRRNYIYGDSIRLWSDVVVKAPNSDRGHSVLASNIMDAYENNDCRDNDLYDRAKKEYEKAISIRYDNATAHVNLAKLYLLKKEYASCIREANEALRLDESVYGYHNLGSAEKALGNMKDAEKAFLSGYKLDKKCTFILRDLGDLYYDMRKYSIAKRYYNEYQAASRVKNGFITDRLKEIS